MAKNTLTWDEYERGRSSPRHGSFTSILSRGRRRGDSSPHGENDGLLGQHHNRDSGTQEVDLRRRRSSIALRINALTQVGGVNSVESFARSWQRAINFHEITPSRSSFLVTEDDQGAIGQQQDEECGQTTHRSLLRQQLEQEGTSSDLAVQEDIEETEDISRIASQNRVASSPIGGDDDIFSQASYLGSSIGSINNGTYGSLSARLNESSKRHASRLFHEQQITGLQEPDKELEPLLVKRVEQEDGKVVLTVVGQSTIYQTVLNSTNVLIGVGLLSLPLGINYAGWLIGLLFLSFAAIITAYTATLLGKCLDVDRGLITFADIAYVSFGSRAKVIIGILFSLELIAACVALFVLFADSLDALIPGWGLLEWKILVLKLIGNYMLFRNRSVCFHRRTAKAAYAWIVA
ncbi:hypothetical protein MMC26_005870 [Xylographa opegraphella]|nr:hypothetical protein [Xylographa opegraphella]